MHAPTIHFGKNRAIETGVRFLFSAAACLRGGAFGIIRAMGDSKEEVEAAINGFLDEIKKTREEMEELQRRIFAEQLRFVYKRVTYEEALKFWYHEVDPKRWELLEFKYRLNEWAGGLAEGGVPQERWGSIRPQFSEWLKSWKSFVNALESFRKPLDAEFHRRRAAKEREEELKMQFQSERAALIEKGRLMGHDDVLSCIGKHDEAMKRAEKAEAELDKLHVKMNCADWEKEVIAMVKETAEDCGLNGAVRLVVKEKSVIEGAKHFKTFGSDGECNPTFEALKQAIKRSKEKQDVKPTERRPRKTRPCDFADGVKVNLPKERYRE